METGIPTKEQGQALIKNKNLLLKWRLEFQQKI